jgi:hypothetical protein
MNGAGNGDDERVLFAPDESSPGRYKPQVSSFGGVRRFEPDDMQRVLDYADMTESPPDGPLLFCEDDGVSGPKFVTYHFCLRGCYLFYFDPSEIDEASGPYATYHSPPIGVVPLIQVAVEFPPGGRRVFREHAQTNARTGYEFVVLHTLSEGDEEPRPPFFMVADSLGRREKWCEALRTRSAKNLPTLLRAGYSTTSRPVSTPTATAKHKLETKAAVEAVKPVERQESAPKKAPTNERQSVVAESKDRSSRSKKRDKKTTDQILKVADDSDLGSAVLEFGAANFDEKDWMDTYFQRHLDFDAVNQCKQMEHWQADMKKSLKGAVLEQYEYFVQASGEMTTMGREVASLKSYIETQVSTIKEMKDIDFSGDLHDKKKSSDADLGVLDPPRLLRPRQHKHALSDDFARNFEEMSLSDSPINDTDTPAVDEEEEEDAPIIDIPEWLFDATAEMSALVRECRYNAAVDLYVKAKADIAETIDKHERPTAFRLKKRQLAQIDDLQKQLNEQVTRISNRLSESLRRKNEALRQASKRDRADVHALTVTNVSPCALNDDMMYLQLLVKLGKTHLAADAYSTRRSLLLFETLHEKPISGAGNVDLVIFAAQLSQSFFSCLATSVEGFLDLFLSPSTTMNNDKHGDDASLGGSSLHSHAAKNVPAGAVASVVLWCDSELAKFSSAFGGTRILANLALSPPPKDAPKQPRVVGQSADEANGSKERKNAIEVAAQCIDQAFMYASENLDSVGLPLTPRLAEFLRSRLKGCESEVALLLDERWHNLTVDWTLPPENLDYPR